MDKQELLDNLKLQLLEAGGVDNWEFYSEAIEQFKKDNNFDEEEPLEGVFLLKALENSGVNNWIFYSEALENYFDYEDYLLYEAGDTFLSYLQFLETETEAEEEEEVIEEEIEEVKFPKLLEYINKNWQFSNKEVSKKIYDSMIYHEEQNIFKPSYLTKDSLLEAQNKAAASYDVNTIGEFKQLAIEYYIEDLISTNLIDALIYKHSILIGADVPQYASIIKTKNGFELDLNIKCLPVAVYNCYIMTLDNDYKMDKKLNKERKIKSFYNKYAAEVYYNKEKEKLRKRMEKTLSNIHHTKYVLFEKQTEE